MDSINLTSEAVADLLIEALGKVDCLGFPAAGGQEPRVFKVEGYEANGDQVMREFTRNEIAFALNKVRHGEWTVSINKGS
jgi:hypothetical protein